MAWTVGNVVAQVKQHFPDITTANAELLFNDIYREVMMDVDFVVEAVSTINLTSGTRLYPLPAGSMQVHKVIYKDGAISFKALAPGTLADLDKKSPLWRTETATTSKPVSQWYIDGTSLGIYPAPDATTVAGIPVVQVYYQPSPTASLVSSDPLPDNIPSLEAFIFGVCYRFSAAWNPPRMAFYQVQYLRARAALDKYFSNRSSANIGMEVNPYTGELNGIQRS